MLEERQKTVVSWREVEEAGSASHAVGVLTKMRNESGPLDLGM